MPVDAEARLRFAEKSYDEVLDATKHQDDKIGRFLTGIAFLFTGAIAFAAGSNLVNIKVSAPGAAALNLPAILLSGFLLLAVLSVVLLAFALGPNLTVPGGSALQPPDDPHRSHLFFLLIGQLSGKTWNQMWASPSPSTEAIAETYLRESRNIAIKTSFKYARTNEARALFTLALYCLASSIGVVGYAAAKSSFPLDGGGVAWSDARVPVAAIAAVFAFLIPYDFMRLEQDPVSYERQGRRARRIWPLHALCFIAPAFCLCVVLAPLGPDTPREWRVAALLLLVAGFVLLMLWPEKEQTLGWRASVSLGIAGLALATGLAIGSVSPGPRVIVASLVIVLAESPRLLVSTRTIAGYRRFLDQGTWQEEVHALRDPRPW